MKPMLAKVGTKQDLTKKGFIFEPKLDGYRALLTVGKTISLRSRNDIDLLKMFPSLDFSTITEPCLIDGEIVSYDNSGNPSFDLLRNSGTPVFVAFDILEKLGKDLTQLTLVERKKILEKAVKENKTLQLIFFTTEGKKLWSVVEKRKLEGVIAKRAHSTYSPGVRSDDWLKIKKVNAIDCVIIGFTSMKREVSSLALGVYDKGKLVYVGKVGTGFNERFLLELRAKLTPDKAEPLADYIPVKPVMVAEIEYLEFTKDKVLRAPVFKRIRGDKNPKDCILPA